MGRFLIFAIALMLAAGVVMAEANSKAQAKSKAEPKAESKTQTLTPRAFTKAVASATKAAIPDAKVRVTGDLELEIRYRDGRDATSQLGNAYSVYQHDPAQLDDVIHNYVAAVAPAQDAPHQSGLDLSHIIPVINSQAWLDHMQKVLKTSGRELLTVEPFAGDLVVVYAEAGTDNLYFLTTRDEVGDAAALHDLALKNLDRMQAKLDLRLGADGVWVISVGGNYESSLVLFDSLWKGTQLKVDGDIVVAIPSKDALIATGSKNAAGIARLRKVAAEVSVKTYGLSSRLFVYRDGKFAPFDEN